MLDNPNIETNNATHEKSSTCGKDKWEELIDKTIMKKASGRWMTSMD